MWESSPLFGALSEQVGSATFSELLLQLFSWSSRLLKVALRVAFGTDSPSLLASHTVRTLTMPGANLPQLMGAMAVSPVWPFKSSLRKPAPTLLPLTLPKSDYAAKVPPPAASASAATPASAALTSLLFMKCSSPPTGVYRRARRPVFLRRT